MRAVRSASGLVANPPLGHLADWLVDAGGNAILGETLAWLRAEHLLTPRARDPALAADITLAVERTRAMAVSAGVDLL